MKKSIFIFVGITVFVGIVAWYLGIGKATPQTQEVATISESPTEGYTLADVAQHKDQSSCWTAVNGKVYDLTNYLTRHEGGIEKIMAVCGIDGTQAFSAQHEGQHEPNEEIEEHYIGDLK